MHGLEHGWGMGWGWFIIIAGTILIIWLVVRTFRQNGGSGTRRSERSALEVLKDRYARGEISREEFEAKKKDLS